MFDIKKKRKDDVQQILLECSCLGEFLKQSYSYLKAESKIFNYSELARRGGFSSRSYIRQVILGEKNITWSSLDGICKAFDLSGDTKKYFTILWEMSSLSDSKELAKYQKKLLTLTKQILRKKDIRDTSIYETEEWPLVYASLGSETGGASLEEIRKRSKLDSKHCVKILEMLDENDLIKNRNERYYPVCNHIALDKLGNDQFFKKYFIKKLNRLKKKTEESFNSDKDLFFQSTTCISSKKMTMFKQELRELMLKYIDSIEDNNGDTAVSFVVSMFEN